MSYLDAIFDSGVASELVTATGLIAVDASTPSAGQTLVAQSATLALWQAVPPTGALALDAGSVDIGGSAPSAGQVLVASDASNAAFADPAPYFGSAKVALARSTNYAIAPGWNTVPMDLVLYDTNSIYDAGSGGVQIQVAGYYLAIVNLTVAAGGTTNELLAGVMLTGSATQNFALGTSVLTANLQHAAGGAALIFAEVSDIIVARAFTAIAMSVGNNSTNSYFHLIGPL